MCIRIAQALRSEKAANLLQPSLGFWSNYAEFNPLNRIDLKGRIDFTHSTFSVPEYAER